MISRPTVTNYLNVTGFVAFTKGWDALRSDDCGILWEHLVLESLFELYGSEAVNYWRDKQKREIDFVVSRKRRVVDTFEAKWSKDSFKSKALHAFRVIYPVGRTFVVAADVIRPYQRDFQGLLVDFIGIPDLNRGVFD